MLSYLLDVNGHISDNNLLWMMNRNGTFDHFYFFFRFVFCFCFCIILAHEAHFFYYYFFLFAFFSFLSALNSYCFLFVSFPFSSVLFLLCKILGFLKISHRGRCMCHAERVSNLKWHNCNCNCFQFKSRSHRTCQSVSMAISHKCHECAPHYTSS